MIEIDTNQCKGCDLCVTACKFEALHHGTERNKKGYLVPAHDGDKCTGCHQCEYICPDLAITVLKED